MKRTLLLVTIISGILSQAAAQAGPPALDAGLGFAASPTLLYNGAWDPGLGGGSAALDLRLSWPGLSARLGVEASVEGLGFVLLAPLGVERTVWSQGRQSLALGLGILPGLAMFKPAPLVVVGGQATLAWSWYWGRHWGLEVDLGARYTACPEYSAKVAPYGVLSLPLALALRFRT